LVKANITRVEEARAFYNIALAEGRSVTLGLVEKLVIFYSCDSIQDFLCKQTLFSTVRMRTLNIFQ